MRIWAEHLLPRLTDVALGTTEVRRHRERAMVGLQSEAVEIGFGSGLHVPLHPPAVHTVYAVEPSMLTRRLAAAESRPRRHRSPPSGWTGRPCRCRTPLPTWR